MNPNDAMMHPSVVRIIKVLDESVKELREELETARADEREACAKVCDQMEQEAEGTECCKWPTPADCAYAIRARGTP